MTGLEMRYFILKPKGNTIYHTASREAMRAYARVIRVGNPQLSDDLQKWADTEMEIADTNEQK